MFFPIFSNQLVFVKKNKVLSLFSATAIIQLSIFLVGLYLLKDINTPEPVKVAIATEAAALESTTSESIDARAIEAIKPKKAAVAKVKAPAKKLKLKKTDPLALPKIEAKAPKKIIKTTLGPIEYTVKSGDTLSSIWTKNGGSYAGAISAAKAFKEAGVSLNTLRPGETVEVKESNGKIQRFAKKLPGAKTLILTAKPDGAYEVNLDEPKITITKKKVSGVILNSFAESAHRVSVPAELIDDFADLFGGRVEFSRNVQPGDVFTVVYSERVTESGERLSSGPIHAASLENRGTMLAAVKHVDSKGDTRFYDENGEPLGNFFLRYPLRFTRISSQFSHSRFHPVLKVRRPHNGVDFAAPIGTPVRSVADGVIKSAGWNGGSGRMVKIKHSNRWSTAYLHLNSISKGMRPGARVKRGQVIGTVGKTGLATGPHLHFSMYDNGRYVDPMKTKLPKMPLDKEVIPAKFLRATLTMLEKEHETLQLASHKLSSSLG